MDSFYGYGNPRITASMGQDDPHLKGICVLVIHGSGPEAWRSETPLSKYIIINLAIKSITVKKMKVSKKKSMSAIYIEEATGDQMTGAIFWNGRKYRYEPLGSSMEWAGGSYPALPFATDRRVAAQRSNLQIPGTASAVPYP